MVISVVFPSKTSNSGWGEKHYHYKSEIDVNVGDVVSVGGTKAKVTAVNVQADPQQTLKTILSLYADCDKVNPPESNKPSFADYVNYGDEDEVPAPEPSPHDDILKIFRLIAKEFSEVKNCVILKIIPLAAQRISRRLFRGVQAQAVAYMTAHILKAAELAYQESEDVHPVASISEADGSTSFVHNSVNLALGDAALRETKYGLEVLALRQPLIMV